MKSIFSSLIVIVSLLVTSCNSNSHREYTIGKDGIYYKYSSHRLYAGTVIDTSNEIIQFTVIWGKMNGEFITKYLNGQIEKFGFIKNNLNEGEWKYYYPNGLLESKGKYKDNEANGNWVYYYPNGIIKAEGDYNKNSKEGKWIFYNRGGEIGTIRYFNNGVLVGMKKFNIST